MASGPRTAITHPSLQAQLAGWPTPTKGNADGSQIAKDASATGRRSDGSKATVSVNQVAQLAGWNTARATDGSHGGPGQTGGALPADAALAGWGTPTVQDSRHGSLSPSEMDRDPRNLRVQVYTAGPARRTATGEMLTGSTAGMESGGQLNPAHSRWLMGYPHAWDDCGVTAMPSARKSRQHS